MPLSDGEIKILLEEAGKYRTAKGDDQPVLKRSLEIYDRLIGQSSLATVYFSERAEVRFRLYNRENNLTYLDGAIADMDSAIRLDPDRGDVYLARGNILMEKFMREDMPGKPGAADIVSDLKACLSRDPTKAAAWLNMMAISIISMDYDGAISLYGQCKAYAKTKEDMLYRAYLGCIACALGGDPVDGEDREVLFDKSISLGIIVSRELNICVFLRRMREKGFSKEKWNRAAETIRLLVSHYEDGCSAGLLLRELSLHEDALEAYVRATERTPREFKAWYNKGFTLWTLCRYESAAKAFDMAVKLKPGSALAWEYKGNMMWYLKHYSEALADFDRSLELDPGSWAAWRGKGVMLHNLNKPGKALKCFDRSLDLKKDYAETWNNKGYALQAVGRFKKALEAYDMALKLDPASEGAQYNKQDLEKTLNQKHWIRKRK